MFDVVERDEVRVEYVASADGIEAIRDAWARLENVVPLRGNRFFGTFGGSEYRACVEVRDTSFGLPAWKIPGGRYARARLRGEPPAVYEQIGPMLEKLESQVDVDRARPVIEHYRRRDEIDLLVPVA